MIVLLFTTAWYLIGLLILWIAFYVEERNKGNGVSFTTRDALQICVGAIAGPLVLIFGSIILLMAVVENLAENKLDINLNKTLWRSKRAFANHILYGDKNDRRTKNHQGR